MLSEEACEVVRSDVGVLESVLPLNEKDAQWQEANADDKAVGNADISKEVASPSQKDGQLVCRKI
jgi:hypothetical protein